MRILTDQDVYKITVDNLIKWEHDVITAKEINMSKATDEELLIMANKTDRILITRDKDFGALLFLKSEFNAGVILLRGSLDHIEGIHHQLRMLLEEHFEEELITSICVVEHNKYRIRHLR
jgi:predicted nuclease of predicted toxin-antitoxin system